MNWGYLIALLLICAVMSAAVVEYFDCAKPSGGVAIFDTPAVKGTVLFSPMYEGTRVTASFTSLTGLHGLHIHNAGDFRGEGCKGACDHYNVGPVANHGGPPGTPGERHIGDLGNVTMGTYTFDLAGVDVNDLYGRSIVVHADEDDYGRGGKPDSLLTGHSGERIACALIGRA